MDDALWKWIKSPEAQKIKDAAVQTAWNEYQQQFPRADISKFESKANFAKNHTASAKNIFQRQFRRTNKRVWF